VGEAIIGVTVPNLSGGVSAMMPNHHITKPVLIGEIQDERPVPGRLADFRPGGGRCLVRLSPRIEGPDLRLAQAAVVRKLQRQDRQVRRPLPSNLKGAVMPHSRSGLPLFLPFPVLEHVKLIRLNAILAALAIAATIVMATLVPAHAEGLADAVQGLKEKSFSKRLKAVDEIAATGDDRAAAVLNSLADGQAYRDQVRRDCRHPRCNCSQDVGECSNG
jgi:hypothetical protein